MAAAADGGAQEAPIKPPRLHGIHGPEAYPYIPITSEKQKAQLKRRRDAAEQLERTLGKHCLDETEITGRILEGKLLAKNSALRKMGRFDRVLADLLDCARHVFKTTPWTLTENQCIAALRKETMFTVAQQLDRRGFPATEAQVHKQRVCLQDKDYRDLTQGCERLEFEGAERLTEVDCKRCKLFLMKKKELGVDRVKDYATRNTLTIRAANFACYAEKCEGEPVNRRGQRLHHPQCEKGQSSSATFRNRNNQDGGYVLWRATVQLLLDLELVSPAHCRLTNPDYWSQRGVRIMEFSKPKDWRAEEAEKEETEWHDRIEALREAQLQRRRARHQRQLYGLAMAGDSASSSSVDQPPQLDHQRWYFVHDSRTRQHPPGDVASDDSMWRHADWYNTDSTDSDLGAVESDVSEEYVSYHEPTNPVKTDNPRFRANTHRRQAAAHRLSERVTPEEARQQYAPPQPCTRVAGKIRAKVGWMSSALRLKRELAKRRRESDLTERKAKRAAKARVRADAAAAGSCTATDTAVTASDGAPSDAHPGPARVHPRDLDRSGNPMEDPDISAEELMAAQIHTDREHFAPLQRERLGRRPRPAADVSDRKLHRADYLASDEAIIAADTHAQRIWEMGDCPLGESSAFAQILKRNQLALQGRCKDFKGDPLLEQLMQNHGEIPRVRDLHANSRKVRRLQKRDGHCRSRRARSLGGESRSSDDTVEPQPTAWKRRPMAELSKDMRAAQIQRLQRLNDAYKHSDVSEYSTDSSEPDFCRWKNVYRGGQYKNSRRQLGMRVLSGLLGERFDYLSESGEDAKLDRRNRDLLGWERCFDREQVTGRVLRRNIGRLMRTVDENVVMRGSARCVSHCLRTYVVAALVIYRIRKRPHTICGPPCERPEGGQAVDRESFYYKYPRAAVVLYNVTDNIKRISCSGCSILGLLGSSESAQAPAAAVCGPSAARDEAPPGDAAGPSLYSAAGPWTFGPLQPTEQELHHAALALTPHRVPGVGLGQCTVITGGSFGDPYSYLRRRVLIERENQKYRASLEQAEDAEVAALHDEHWQRQLADPRYGPGPTALKSDFDLDRRHARMVGGWCLERFDPPRRVPDSLAWQIKEPKGQEAILPLTMSEQWVSCRRLLIYLEESRRTASWSHRATRYLHDYLEDARFRHRIDGGMRFRTEQCSILPKYNYGDFQWREIMDRGVEFLGTSGHIYRLYLRDDACCPMVAGQPLNIQHRRFGLFLSMDHRSLKYRGVHYRIKNDIECHEIRWCVPPEHRRTDGRVIELKIRGEVRIANTFTMPRGFWTGIDARARDEWRTDTLIQAQRPPEDGDNIGLMPEKELRVWERGGWPRTQANNREGEFPEDLHCFIEDPVELMMWIKLMLADDRLKRSGMPMVHNFDEDTVTVLRHVRPDEPPDDFRSELRRWQPVKHSDGRPKKRHMRPVRHSQVREWAGAYERMIGPLFGYRCGLGGPWKATWPDDPRKRRWYVVVATDGLKQRYTRDLSDVVSGVQERMAPSRPFLPGEQFLVHKRVENWVMTEGGYWVPTYIDGLGVQCREMELEGTWEYKAPPQRVYVCTLHFLARYLLDYGVLGTEPMGTLEWESVADDPDQECKYISDHLLVHTFNETGLSHVGHGVRNETRVLFAQTCKYRKCDTARMRLPRRKLCDNPAKARTWDRESIDNFELPCHQGCDDAYCHQRWGLWRPPDCDEVIPIESLIRTCGCAGYGLDEDTVESLMTSGLCPIRDNQQLAAIGPYRIRDSVDVAEAIQWLSRQRFHRYHPGDAVRVIVWHEQRMDAEVLGLGDLAEDDMAMQTRKVYLKLPDGQEATTIHMLAAVIHWDISENQMTIKYLPATDYDGTPEEAQAKALVGKTELVDVPTRVFRGVKDTALVPMTIIDHPQPAEPEEGQKRRGPEPELVPGSGWCENHYIQVGPDRSRYALEGGLYAWDVSGCRGGELEAILNPLERLRRRCDGSTFVAQYRAELRDLHRDEHSPWHIAKYCDTDDPDRYKWPPSAVLYVAFDTQAQPQFMWEEVQNDWTDPRAPRAPPSGYRSRRNRRLADRRRQAEREEGLDCLPGTAVRLGTRRDYVQFALSPGETMQTTDGGEVIDFALSCPPLNSCATMYGHTEVAVRVRMALKGDRPQVLPNTAAKMHICSDLRDDCVRGTEKAYFMRDRWNRHLREKGIAPGLSFAIDIPSMAYRIRCEPLGLEEMRIQIYGNLEDACTLTDYRDTYDEDAPWYILRREGLGLQVSDDEQDEDDRWATSSNSSLDEDGMDEDVEDGDHVEDGEEGGRHFGAAHGDAAPGPAAPASCAMEVDGSADPPAAAHVSPRRRPGLASPALRPAAPPAGDGRSAARDSGMEIDGADSPCPPARPISVTPACSDTDDSLPPRSPTRPGKRMRLHRSQLGRYVNSFVEVIYHSRPTASDDETDLSSVAPEEPGVVAAREEHHALGERAVQRRQFAQQQQGGIPVLHADGALIDGASGVGDYATALAGHQRLQEQLHACWMELPGCPTKNFISLPFQCLDESEYSGTPVKLAPPDPSGRCMGPHAGATSYGLLATGQMEPHKHLFPPDSFVARRETVQRNHMMWFQLAAGEAWGGAQSTPGQRPAPLRLAPGGHSTIKFSDLLLRLHHHFKLHADRRWEEEEAELQSKQVAMMKSGQQDIGTYGSALAANGMHNAMMVVAQMMERAAEMRAAELEEQGVLPGSDAEDVDPRPAEGRCRRVRRRRLVLTSCAAVCGDAQHRAEEARVARQAEEMGQLPQAQRRPFMKHMLAQRAKLGAAAAAACLRYTGALRIIRVFWECAGAPSECPFLRSVVDGALAERREAQQWTGPGGCRSEPSLRIPGQQLRLAHNLAAGRARQCGMEPPTQIMRVVYTFQPAAMDCTPSTADGEQVPPEQQVVDPLWSEIEVCYDVYSDKPFVLSGDLAHDQVTQVLREVEAAAKQMNVIGDNSLYTKLLRKIRAMWHASAERGLTEAHAADWLHAWTMEYPEGIPETRVAACGARRGSGDPAPQRLPLDERHWVAQIPVDPSNLEGTLAAVEQAVEEVTRQSGGFSPVVAISYTAVAGPSTLERLDDKEDQWRNTIRGYAPQEGYSATVLVHRSLDKEFLGQADQLIEFCFWPPWATLSDGSQQQGAAILARPTGRFVAEADFSWDDRVVGRLALALNAPQLQALRSAISVHIGPNWQRREDFELHVRGIGPLLPGFGAAGVAWPEFNVSFCCEGFSTDEERELVRFVHAATGFRPYCGLPELHRSAADADQENSIFLPRWREEVLGQWKQRAARLEQLLLRMVNSTMIEGLVGQVPEAGGPVAWAHSRWRWGIAANRHWSWKGDGKITDPSRNDAAFDHDVWIIFDTAVRLLREDAARRGYPNFPRSEEWPRVYYYMRQMSRVAGVLGWTERALFWELLAFRTRGGRRWFCPDKVPAALRGESAVPWERAFPAWLQGLSFRGDLLSGIPGLDLDGCQDAALPPLLATARRQQAQSPPKPVPSGSELPDWASAEGNTPEDALARMARQNRYLGRASDVWKAQSDPDCPESLAGAYTFWSSEVQHCPKCDRPDGVENPEPHQFDGVAEGRPWRGPAKELWQNSHDKNYAAVTSIHRGCQHPMGLPRWEDMDDHPTATTAEPRHCMMILDAEGKKMYTVYAKDRNVMNEGGKLCDEKMQPAQCRVLIDFPADDGQLVMRIEYPHRAKLAEYGKRADYRSNGPARSPGSLEVEADDFGPDCIQVPLCRIPRDVRAAGWSQETEPDSTPVRHDGSVPSAPQQFVDLHGDIREFAAEWAGVVRTPVPEDPDRTMVYLVRRLSGGAMQFAETHSHLPGQVFVQNAVRADKRCSEKSRREAVRDCPWTPVPGARVVTHSLSAVRHNGRTGVLLHYLPDSERWAVQFDTRLPADPSPPPAARPKPGKSGKKRGGAQQQQQQQQQQSGEDGPEILNIRAQNLRRLPMAVCYGCGKIGHGAPSDPTGFRFVRSSSRDVDNSAFVCSTCCEAKFSDPASALPRALRDDRFPAAVALQLSSDSSERSTDRPWWHFPVVNKVRRYALMDGLQVCYVSGEAWMPWPMVNPPVPAPGDLVTGLRSSLDSHPVGRRDPRWRQGAVSLPVRGWHFAQPPHWDLDAARDTDQWAPQLSILSPAMRGANPASCATPWCDADGEQWTLAGLPQRTVAVCSWRRWTDRQWDLRGKDAYGRRASYTFKEHATTLFDEGYDFWYWHYNYRFWDFWKRPWNVDHKHFPREMLEIRSQVMRMLYHQPMFWDYHGLKDTRGFLQWAELRPDRSPYCQCTPEQILHWHEPREDPHPDGTPGPLKDPALYAGDPCFLEQLEWQCEVWGLAQGQRGADYFRALGRWPYWREEGLCETMGWKYRPTFRRPNWTPTPRFVPGRKGQLHKKRQKPRIGKTGKTNKGFFRKGEYVYKGWLIWRDRLMPGDLSIGRYVTPDEAAMMYDGIWGLKWHCEVMLRVLSAAVIAAIYNERRGTPIPLGDESEIRRTIIKNYLGFEGVDMAVPPVVTDCTCWKCRLRVAGSGPPAISDAPPPAAAATDAAAPPAEGALRPLVTSSGLTEEDYAICHWPRQSRIHNVVPRECRRGPELSYLPEVGERLWLDLSFPKVLWLRMHVSGAVGQPVRIRELTSLRFCSEPGRLPLLDLWARRYGEAELPNTPIRVLSVPGRAPGAVATVRVDIEYLLSLQEHLEDCVQKGLPVGQEKVPLKAIERNLQRLCPGANPIFDGPIPEWGWRYARSDQHNCSGVYRGAPHRGCSKDHVLADHIIDLERYTVPDDNLSIDRGLFPRHIVPAEQHAALRGCILCEATHHKVTATRPDGKVVELEPVERVFDVYPGDYALDWSPAVNPFDVPLLVQSPAPSAAAAARHPAAKA
eukprot:TRINITY_DN8510_c3_g1_i1.p1 TRINITY_DN8510_c3_g1~~TRINITY_DN8510_c3_g1_i1.p1  ORF type:complete len:4911 (+),score=1402.21 TRINITY_DN8510_c3_g1_i1:142-14733(+)